MLAQEILKLEHENQRLKEQLAQLGEDFHKPKNCVSCKHYVQHYIRVSGGYYPLYFGHCVCGVPIKERKGKKDPALNDTCLCFEEGFHY